MDNCLCIIIVRTVCYAWSVQVFFSSGYSKGFGNIYETVPTIHAVCWHNTVTFPSDLFGRTKGSRLSSVYVCRPLDLYRPSVVSEKLMQFETEMKQ